MRITPGNLPEPRTDYEAKAVAFCRAWLSGQSTFVLHTSGSTGTPKPIVLNRRQLKASAHLTGKTFGLQPGDRALVCLNVDYVAGVMMLVRGLELGMEMLVIEPSSNPIPLPESEANCVDFAAFVPLQMDSMLNKPEQTLPVLNRMKAMLVGGAAVDRSLAERIQAIEAPVFSTYGMTETVSHIAIRRINGPERTELFQALEGVEIGVDERNCLTIKAAATDFKLIQTNDIVELIDHRRFRLVGRADSIINSGGVKIQPERIEAVIADFLANEQESTRFFIAGLPDSKLGQQVALFVESQTDWPKNRVEAIKIAIRQELGAFYVPKRFLYTTAFGETPTGKTDRKAVVASVLSKLSD